MIVDGRGKAVHFSRSSGSKRVMPGNLNDLLASTALLQRKLMLICFFQVFLFVVEIVSDVNK